MQLSFNVYSLALLIFGCALAFLTIYTFYRLQTKVKWFALTMLGVIIWTVFYAFELASADLEAILSWAKLQYLGIVIVPPSWFLFCLSYTGKDSKLKNPLKAALFVIPVLTLLVIFTNNLHHAHYQSVEVINKDGFMFLNIGKGPWYYVHVMYSYLLILMATFLLIIHFKYADSTYKWHVFLLLTAAMFPWMVNVLYLAGFRPHDHIELTPYAFLASGIVVALGLLRYKLFNVSPIAKDKLISVMTDGLLVSDANGLLVDFNPAMKRILGLGSSKACIGEPIVDVVDVKEIKDRLFERTRETIEITGFGTMGRDYLIELIPLGVKGEKLVGQLILFRDISEIKQAQDLLKLQTEKLKQDNELKDKLFSIISHDLKGPILGIKEIIDLARQEGMAPEEFNEILPEFSKSINGISLLLENLLAWSKSQFKGEYLDKVSFDVHKMVLQQIRLMEPMALHKKIEMNTKGNAPMIAHADKNMVELVIRNLLSNAVKFCNTGDHILIAFEEVDGFVKVFVRDTGIGISKDNLDRLRKGDSFSTFGSNNESGTGLGLLLVRDYINKNGGRLYIDSIENEWSEFSFILPQEHTV